MTEASTPQPRRPQSPEELHWGIAYLREDLQDMRQEVRGEIQQVRNEVHGLRQEIRQEISAVHSRIDQTAKDFSQRLDVRFSSLTMTMAAIGGLIVSLIGVVIVMIKD